MMIKPGVSNKLALTFFCLLTCLHATAQPDLVNLRLSVIPDFIHKSISVTSSHEYTVSRKDSSINLLLHPQFKVNAVVSANAKINWERSYNGISVKFAPGKTSVILDIDYSGKPEEAIKPPWQDGFVWKTDNTGKHWLAVTCQRQGAQLWWPAPELYSDEPSSAKITCKYPRDLFFKGNGKMVSDEEGEEFRTTTWEVTYPVNVYEITLNVGNYAHLKDSLVRRDGTVMRLDYFPLSYNQDKAIKQFSQVKPMLTCFEKAFGNYPFEKDGYSIVETPYEGMEHQGAIAYGNGYINGYRGTDYSTINLPFDFILIHETAHEWFGNSVTAKNKTDFWLQEAFCTYAEMTYVECLFSREKALAYINAKKRLVKNKTAILSDTSIGIDMYAKGSLMIHTVSQFSPSPEAWKKTMKEFVAEFAYKSIDTPTLINWFCNHLPGLKPEFFYQYLRNADIPALEYSVSADKDKWKIKYRIVNADTGFSLPLTWIGKGKSSRHDASKEWKVFYSDDPATRPDESLSYFRTLKL